MAALFTVFVILTLFVDNGLSRLTMGKISVVCGDWKKNTPAKITYVGEAKAVYAFQPKGDPCAFVPHVSSASFTLDVYYKHLSGKCVFVKTSPYRDAYCIGIESRMLHADFESGTDESFLVECAYMAYRENVKAKLNLIEPFKAMKTFLYNEGLLAKSNFSVKLMDVSKNVIISAIEERHIVRVIAHMDKAKGSNEIGFLPLECLAQSFDKKVKITILADGCGTGYPWKKTQGFVMKGSDGKSPFFRAFKFSGSSMIISCSFVACTNNCEGNTCSAASRQLRRKRRSTDIQYDVFGLITPESKGVSRADAILDFKNDETPSRPGAMEVATITRNSDQLFYQLRNRYMIITLLVVFGVLVAVVSLTLLCLLLKYRRESTILSVKT